MKNYTQSFFLWILVLLVNISVVKLQAVYDENLQKGRYFNAKIHAKSLEQRSKFEVQAFKALELALSDVYVVAQCSPKDKTFDICVSRQPIPAEKGYCRTKQPSWARSRRLTVALKGTELCSKNPFVDTLRLLLFGPAPGGIPSQDRKDSLSECFVPIGPFESYNASITVQRGKAVCSIATQTERSVFRMSLLVIGIVLIISSSYLSNSLSLRMGIGASFAVISGVFLSIYFLSRRPRTTVMSSTVFAIAAMYQTWWRSLFSESNMNALVAIYCASFACIGATIVYYFDSTFSSSRMLAITSTAFQAMGVFFIYQSLHSPLLVAIFTSFAFATRVLRIKIVSNTLISMLGLHMGARAHNEPNADAQQVSKGSSTPLKASSPKTPRPNKMQNGALTQRKEKSFSPFRAQKSPASKLDHSENEKVADIVKRGQVYNEETKRVIGIGKGTYNKLISNGWTMNKGNGIISPPKKPNNQ